MSRKILTINFDDETKEYTDGCVFPSDIYTFLCLSNTNFKDKLTSEEFYQKIKENLEHDLKVPYDEESAIFIKKELDKINACPKEEYLNDYKTVKFESDKPHDYLTFIKENLDFLSDKDIILPGLFNLTDDDYLHVTNPSKNMKEYFPNANIYLNVDGDCLISSLDDYKKAYEKIYNIVNLIKSLNLSPLEQVMFAYDICKDRQFKQGTTEEEMYKSCDLISSLNDEFIICAGYDAIFRAILTNLGISSKSVILEGTSEFNKEGHVRTAVYIDDPKYNVEGHYFFNVTADAKKDESDDYKNKYGFFARTFEEIILADKLKGFAMTEEKYLYPNYIYELFKGLKDTYSYTDFIKLRTSNKFNFYLKNLGIPQVKIQSEGNKKEDLMKALERIYESFNRPVEPETFVELLYNVRKAEYCLNPNSTPFSIEDLKEGVKINQFSRIFLDQQTKEYIANVLQITEREYLEREQDRLFRKTLTQEKEIDITATKLIK
ncbi:MAG: hypothetical protein J1F35_00175 [Erysipelotrichales bacterium]|nr:hypothetical protein [Erysipelotrichales bacterium]